VHVLVTGASSFIGRHATVALARAGLRVTATYRSNNATLERLRGASPDTEFVRLDLGREHEFAALPKKIDSIVHVAGVSAMPDITVDDILACNVVGARNLLNYAHSAGASRIVLASTLSVHGDIEEQVVTETTPVRAPDLYGASKYLAERLFAADAHRLPCAAIRLPGVLGEGAHRAWIPTLLELMRRNQDVTVYGSESMFNNAAHVSDICSLMLNLLRNQWSGFHAFPVGAGGQITIAELIRILVSGTGSRSKITEGSALKKPFTLSSKYAEENFGYAPMSIEVMLSKYVSEIDHVGRSDLEP
jgi:nucleoside-diphosphate-sugar epimerase